MKKIIRKVTPEYIWELRNKIFHKKNLRNFHKKNLEAINEISKRETIFLELGASDIKREDFWVTSDISRKSDIYLDLLKPFPFPNNSIDKIYSSHVLEHFKTKEIIQILKEVNRVLKPGGLISTCVPNSAIYIDAYSKDKTLDPGTWLGFKPASEQIYSKIDYINYIGHLDGYHKHLFDVANLIQLLENVGFKKAKEREFDSSLDLKVRDYESIYVDAIK